MQSDSRFDAVAIAFELAWKGRLRSFERSCAQTAMDFGGRNMLTSSPYMAALQRHGIEALDGAFEDVIDNAEKVIRTQGVSDDVDPASELTALIYSCLRKSASTLDAKLKSAAKAVGFESKESVAAHLEELLSKAKLEAEVLVANIQRETANMKTDDPPWYQRPLGLIVITVFGGILLAIVLRLLGF